MKSKLQQLAHFIWFKHPILFWLLIPFSLLYAVVTVIRRYFYKIGLFSAYQSPVPVLIIGNLTVGGNGKTPLAIWLVELLKQRHITVGVISRGYGSKAPYYPFLVNQSNDATVTGDEPLLIHKRTGVDVVIASNRQLAIELLLTTNPQIQLIISDDGLQHYALKRDIEWVVVDANKKFGNQWLLPAGPMRESTKRLAHIDAVIFNHGHINAYLDNNSTINTKVSELDKNPIVITASMSLEANFAINILTGEKKSLEAFTDVHAIAGIGFPERFFNLLIAHRITLISTTSFADHHAYVATDFDFLLNSLTDDTPLLMTEKDAIKCTHIATANWWYVPIESKINSSTTDCLLTQIEHILNIPQA